MHNGKLIFFTFLFRGSLYIHINVFNRVWHLVDAHSLGSGAVHNDLVKFDGFARLRLTDLANISPVLPVNIGNGRPRELALTFNLNSYPQVFGGPIRNPYTKIPTLMTQISLSFDFFIFGIFFVDSILFGCVDFFLEKIVAIKDADSVLCIRGKYEIAVFFLVTMVAHLDGIFASWKFLKS